MKIPTMKVLAICSFIFLFSSALSAGGQSIVFEPLQPVVVKPVQTVVVEPVQAVVVKPLLSVAVKPLVKPLPATHSPESANTLKTLLTKLNRLGTDFQQTVYSAEGDVIQQTAGQLQAARPGKVRWSTMAPMEQLVVSDNSTLWIYDPDLEQVTVRSFDQDLLKTPAALFIGDLDTLEQSYEVQKKDSAITEDGTSTQFILTPKDAESLYTKIALGFFGETPSSMTMWDTLGQKTHITFQGIQVNQDIAPEAFQFSPPEGTDIIRDE